MGLRFRRSIKILPGVRLNFSRSGVSTSIGVRGAHVTYSGGGKVRETVGIPGTGLSYTTTRKQGGTSSREGANGSGVGFFRLLGIGILTLLAFLVVTGLLSGR